MHRFLLEDRVREKEPLQKLCFPTARTASLELKAVMGNARQKSAAGQRNSYRGRGNLLLVNGNTRFRRPEGP